MPQYLAFGFDTHVSLHHIFAVFDCTRRPSDSTSPKNLYKACRQLFVFVCGRYSSGESCYICLKYCALTLRLTSKAPETYCMLLRLLIQQFPVMFLWPSRSCCLSFQKGGTGPPWGDTIFSLAAIYSCCYYITTLSLHSLYSFCIILFSISWWMLLSLLCMGNQDLHVELLLHNCWCGIDNFLCLDACPPCSLMLIAV